MDEVCSGRVPLSPPAEGSSRAGALVRRALSTLVLLPVVLGIVVWGPAAVFTAMIVLLGGLGQWEFLRMFQRAGVPVLSAVGMVGGVAVTASFAVPALAPVALTVVVLGVLAAGLGRPPGRALAWEPAIVTLAGVCYVNWLLGHALELRALAGGVSWILLLVWVTWVGETTAYAVGSTIGRHKLAPTISPKKTVEGAVAQLLASPAAALVAQPWVGAGFSPLEAVAIGLALGVAGQVGDLVESLVKRTVGAKDTGHLIPGHGGVLDRLDGLLFNTPVLFYYVACSRGTGA